DQELHVHHSGGGAQGDAAKGPEARRRARVQPAPGVVRDRSEEGRVHRLDHRRPATEGAGRRSGQERWRDVQTDPQGRQDRRADLPDRRHRPARRLDVADREHDPAVDLLAAARDRGDETRRRHELVRARAVHARGPAVRHRRIGRRRRLAAAREDRRAAGDPRPHRRQQGRERARVRAERADHPRHRALPRRRRLGPHAPALPQSLTDRLVVEVARRGKLLVGEPFFVPGVPLTLDRKGVAPKPGDLAVVARGRGRARVEDVLGSAKDIEAVLEGLLVEHGARTRFEPYSPPRTSLAGREDLRSLVTFTIGPETAKDFDDAISVRRDADGLRAWVHIADVSYYVRAGSALDHGASRRSFTFYVPGRAAPMLPPELADDLCSLRPNVDRLTVTVEVPFDA